MSAPNGKCRICKHAERQRIELLCAGGASIKAVSRKFGVPYDSLYRHWAGHVTDERRSALMFGPVQREALASHLAEESSSVIEHYRAVRAGLYALYDAAVTAGDRNGGAMLAGRLHENLAAMARLTGQLAQSPLVQVNQTNVFINDPAFANFQADLIRVLGRYPDAREAVIAEFERLEVQSAALPALEHHSNGA
jgi:transposase-like protein